MKIIAALLFLAGCSTHRIPKPPDGYTAQEWARKTWAEEASAVGYDKKKFAPLWRNRSIEGWEKLP